MKGAAIITAAGASRRMGGIKKEYLPLASPSVGNEKPTVLGSAVRAFAALPHIGLIVITVPEGGEDEARSALSREIQSGEKEILFAPGGPTRRASVHHALSLLEKHTPPWVLIHDGARPWISPALIEKVIDAVVLCGAAIPILPLEETPKEVDFSGPGFGFIVRHLKRANLGTAQTPQGFRFPEILRAHEKAAERESLEKTDYTDDAEVWGEFIGPVAVVAGERANRKITFPGDLERP